MKEYIRQFYNEGFATTFIKKPVKFLKKHIKNEKIVKILTILIKIMTATKQSQDFKKK